MKVSSNIIAALLDYAVFRHGMPCRIEFSLGWGCTVVEIWSRDMPELTIPLERIVV